MSSNIVNKIRSCNAPEFYKKVWLACLDIPTGSTRSYKWVAERIGSPNACRAVGQALKHNPFAPVVPCHRVIRSDGRLGGYSADGGIIKKKRLLTKEHNKRKIIGR
jgi:O-6-methylguanine DNA methyltransferase